MRIFSNIEKKIFIRENKALNNILIIDIFISAFICALIKGIRGSNKYNSDIALKINLNNNKINLDELIDYFKDSQNETEKKIGRNLSNLKSSRIKADYKNGFKNNSVRDSKVKAEKVFELFKDLED